MNDDELDTQLKELFQSDVLTIDADGPGADSLFEAIIDDAAMTTVISAGPSVSATEADSDDDIIIDFRRPEAAPARGRFLVAAGFVIIALLSLGLLGLAQSGDSPVSSNDGTVEETPTDVNQDGTDENSSALLGAPSEFVFVRNETEVVSRADGVETVVWSIDTAIAAGSADGSDTIESLELLDESTLWVNLCCDVAQTWVVDLEAGTSMRMDRPDAGIAQSPAAYLPDGRSLITIAEERLLFLSRSDGRTVANRTLRDAEVFAHDSESNVFVVLKTQGGADDGSILVLLDGDDLSTVGQIDLDGHFDDVDVADGLYLLTRDDGQVQLLSDRGDVRVVIEGGATEALWLDSTPAGATAGLTDIGSPAQARQTLVAAAESLFENGLDRAEVERSFIDDPNSERTAEEQISALFDNFGWLEGELALEVNFFVPFEGTEASFPIATVRPEGGGAAASFLFGGGFDGPDSAELLSLPTIEDFQTEVVAQESAGSGNGVLLTVATAGGEGGVAAFLDGEQVDATVDQGAATTTIVLSAGFESGSVLTIVTSTAETPTVAVVLGE